MNLYSFPPQRSFAPLVIPQDVAVYRVKEGKFYADDELFEAGTIITWPDEPNQELEPLNDIAKKAMRSYLEKLDAHGRDVATKAGKAYVSQLDAFENAYALAKQDGRRVGVLNGNSDANILGAPRKEARGKRVDMPQEASAEIKTPRPSGRPEKQAVNGSNEVI